MAMWKKENNFIWESRLENEDQNLKVSFKRQRFVHLKKSMTNC